MGTLKFVKDFGNVDRHKYVEQFLFIITFDGKFKAETFSPLYFNISNFDYFSFCNILPVS